jgi:hypothetical protein
MLRVHLYRPWFDAIALGYKKSEFRKATPYWKTRIVGREYDTVQLRNGYCPGDPTLIVEYQGYEEVEVNGEPYYRLQLGAIRELRNYALPALAELPSPDTRLDLNQCIDPKQHGQHMTFCDKTQCWLPKVAVAPEVAPEVAPDIRQVSDELCAWGREVGRIVL